MTELWWWSARFCSLNPVKLIHLHRWLAGSWRKLETWTTLLFSFCFTEFTWRTNVDKSFRKQNREVPEKIRTQIQASCEAKKNWYHHLDRLNFSEQYGRQILLLIASMICRVFEIFLRRTVFLRQNINATDNTQLRTFCEDPSTVKND